MRTKWCHSSVQYTVQTEHQSCSVLEEDGAVALGFPPPGVPHERVTFVSWHKH